MDTSRIDAAVIGAGVVGLAAAWSIARRGHSVCVLERERRPGLATSTHNSQVIHAGMYYPPGTLKARYCVEGARMLYDFCAAHSVPHRRCGKLIVAHDPHDIEALEALRSRGEENGARRLAIVDAAFLQREQRDGFRRMAERLGAACVIAACTAPEATLRRRVSERAARARDASDAGAAVLDHQLAAGQPLAQEEEAIAVRVDTASEDGIRRGLDAIAARFAAREETLAPH